MKRRVGERLLVSLLGMACLCAGAAEFPAFRMDEFQEREEFTIEEPDVVKVPEVSKRDYSTEELTRRFPVEGIVIEGVVPFPDYGITQESVQELIDRRLREETAVFLDENGFTERELEDIGGYIREMLDRGVWDEDDLDDLMEITQRSGLQRGWITIEQLDSIALDVTNFYRERGFILATAFIPQQEVTDNVVRFQVLEGRLGEVTVSNNNVYTPETIRAAFVGEIGEPVTEERVEGTLRRINDLPGVRVRGSFSPGGNVGETSLDLGVQEEQAWGSALVFDNHGSEATGVHRLFGSTEWFNIANLGHRLTVGILRSEGPDSSVYGVAEYSLPVTEDRRGQVKFSISQNQFDVTGLGVSVQNITGETNNYGVTGEYQFVRSRTFNLGAQAGYTQKDVLFDVGVASLSTDQLIEVGSVAVDYNQLWDEQQLLVSGRLGIDEGHIADGAARNQSTNFTKVLFSANILKRFSIGNWITKNDETSFNFVVRVNGQYAEKFLPSVEQFSLGGPNAVRAFSVSDVSVDSAGYAGFELFFDDPVNVVEKFDLPLEPLRPFLFFDYGYGVGRTISGNDNRDAILKAWGLGLRFSWAGRATANLVFAEPWSADYDESVNTRPEGESQIFFDIRYQLR